MTKDILKITKKRLKDLLNILNIKADVSFEASPQTLHIKLTKTKDAALLIGFQGENLRALQHILRILLFKDTGGEAPVIILDVEDYRKKEEEKLKEFVKSTALIVKKTKRAEVLRPMSSYKRRLVHLACSEISGIETESVGEGPERRIIIKPENSK